jgi:hypothetical protein
MVRRTKMKEEPTKVILEGRLIGYVIKLNKYDYCICGYDCAKKYGIDSCGAGKFETFEDAEKCLVERYNIVKWETGEIK